MIPTTYRADRDLGPQSGAPPMNAPSIAATFELACAMRQSPECPACFARKPAADPKPTESRP